MGFIESNPSSTIREHNRFWFWSNIAFAGMCVVFSVILGIWGKVLLWLIPPFVLYNCAMSLDRLQYLKVSRILYKNTPVPGFWKSLIYKGDM